MADFKEALKKAKKMIHEDAKVDSKIIKERVTDRNQANFFAGQPDDAYSQISSIKRFQTEDADDESDYSLNKALDSMTSNLTEAISARSSVAVPPTPSSNVLENVKHSKMPQAILKSLSENFIDQSKLAVGLNPLNDITQEIVNEAPKPAPMPVNNIREELHPSNGVDYSLIKTIVEECVRKYTSSIIKKVLTEQKSATNNELKAIRIGEGFTFITSNGDLYEAELKFKKNINDKVKKGN